MRQVIGNNDTESEGRGLSLWDQIIRLLEQELDWHRSRKLFVTLQGESGSYQKEIGELSALERRSLAPALREYVAEQLLERYLAEQGSVDLLERRRAYTKHIRDLTPTDLPALIEAERCRVEECQDQRERSLWRLCAAIWSGWSLWLVWVKQEDHLGRILQPRRKESHFAALPELPKVTKRTIWG